MESKSDSGDRDITHGEGQNYPNHAETYNDPPHTEKYNDPTPEERYNDPNHTERYNETSPRERYNDPIPADGDNDPSTAEGCQLLQGCARPLQGDHSAHSDCKYDKIVTPTGETKANDVEGAVVKKPQKDTKDILNIYNCKPEPSWWQYVPKPVRTKWKRLKSWFWGDMSKTHLIWIKLIFFFQSASLVVLYPYLVIHMRSLGLSVEEVGSLFTLLF